MQSALADPKRSLYFQSSTKTDEKWVPTDRRGKIMNLDVLRQ